MPGSGKQPELGSWIPLGLEEGPSGRREAQAEAAHEAPACGGCMLRLDLEVTDPGQHGLLKEHSSPGLGLRTPSAPQGPPAPTPLTLQTDIPRAHCEPPGWDLRAKGC